MLSWSTDGGYTWSNDHPAFIGQQGQYMTRAMWRRLGYSKDRVFRIAMSDPVRKILLSAYVDAVGGA
jgi:hypothetical protein